MATLDLADRVITAELMRQCFMKAVGIPEVPPPMTVERYIVSLCRGHHVAGATVGTMRRAAERFRAIGELEAASLADRKADQEFGHDALALKDLRALGLPRNLVASIHPDSAKEIVGAFTRLADEPRPFGVFGYAYALEYGMSLVTQDQVRAFQRLVPPGVDITRFLRVHAGVDQEHADEVAELVCRLEHQDRLSVMAAVQETVPLIVSAAHDQSSDETLKSILAETQWSIPEAA